MHWLGEIRNDNTEFLKEADRLASTGIASVLPLGFFPWVKSQKGVPEDIQLIKSQVSDMAETLAFFRKRPEIDGTKLLFVGHDYGAMNGILLFGLSTAVIFEVLRGSLAHLEDLAHPLWSL